MKKSFIKPIAVTLLAALSVSTLTACSGNNSSGDTSSASDVTASDIVSDSESDNSSDKTENNDSQSGTAEDEASENVSKADETDEKENGELPEISAVSEDDVGFENGGLIVYNNSLYEKCYAYEDFAVAYADSVNTFKSGLGDDIKVYNVLVPTHCGVTLPENVMDEYGLPDQNKYIETIINSYTEDITGVNTYDTLAHHRDEYLYFNTDHHWTGLGAYYAYKDFCKAAGVDYILLSDMEKNVIDDYTGSLAYYADDYVLEENVATDSIEYFSMDKDVEAEMYDTEGNGPYETSVINEGCEDYLVFLGGDSSLMVSKNSDGNGKKIAVVKESYGNAFCTFMAYTYSEVHMIDLRYFESTGLDFKQYLEDNGIDEVVVINNNMATATDMILECLEGLVS